MPATPLLGYARRMLDLNEEMAQALAGATVETAVRIGVPETSSMRRPRMLAAFSRRHPQVKLEISSGLSRDLAQGFDHGELDLVLVKQRRNSRQAVHRRREPMHWIDSLRSSCLQQDPLPLVTFRRAGCTATR